MKIGCQIYLPTELFYFNSCSHTVFSITVHITEKSLEGDERLKTGKLNFFDVAGSEIIGQSGAVDRRASEADNQSLLTLTDVLLQLCWREPLMYLTGT
jgi:kinesin family protein 11